MGDWKEREREKEREQKIVGERKKEHFGICV